MNRFARAASATCLALFSAHTLAASYEEGLRLKSQQQLARAAVVFAEVAAREPSNALAREQLAVVLGWQNRFPESIAAWREAITLAPTKPDYHVGLARVQYWSADRAAALRSLDTALGIAPDNVEALKLKGDVLMADHDPLGARTAYQQAQQLDPHDAELETRIARAVAPLLWRLDAGGFYRGSGLLSTERRQKPEQIASWAMEPHAEPRMARGSDPARLCRRRLGA